MSVHHLFVERDEDGEIEYLTFACTGAPTDHCHIYPDCDDEYACEHEPVPHDDCALVPWLDGMDVYDLLEYGTLAGHADDGGDLDAVDHAELVQSGPVDLDWQGEGEVLWTLGAAEIVPQPCPECRAGKHGNCDGQAWDYVADVPAACPCAGGGHR